MINVTQGNDETLFVTFTRGGDAYMFDKVTKARLVSDYGRAYGMAFTDCGSGLLMQLPHTMPPGCYGLEVCGTEGTLERRTASMGILKVTVLTERGDCRIEGGCDDYDITMSVSLVDGLTAGVAAESISTARFLTAMLDGTLDEGMLYSVGQPSEEGIAGVALYKGKRHVGGLDTNGMRSLKVAWEDTAMRSAAMFADGLYASCDDEEKEGMHGPYTYGDLMDMDDDGFARMMDYYRPHVYIGSGKMEMSSFFRVRILPELELCRSVQTMPGDGRVREDGFSGCSLLSSIPLARELTAIGPEAFFRCSSLKTVNLPRCTKVETSAFAYCSSLTTIELPQCVKIGDYAFGLCSSLRTVNLPQCAAVWDAAFSYCELLRTVNLPQCAAVWGAAFTDCDSLRTVNLPQCSTLGEDVFANCDLLRTLVLGATPPTGDGISSIPSACTVYVPDAAVATYQADDNWKSKNIKPLSQRPAE